MIEILDIEGNLNSLILSIEEKFMGKNIPETSLKAIEKLKTISRVVSIVDKNHKSLENDLVIARKSHTVTSNKYCKAMVLNSKMLQVIKELEAKNSLLLKGLE